MITTCQSTKDDTIRNDHYSSIRHGNDALPIEFDALIGDPSQVYNLSTSSGVEQTESDSIAELKSALAQWKPTPSE